jgi:hypothetical protein
MASTMRTATPLPPTPYSLPHVRPEVGIHRLGSEREAATMDGAPRVVDGGVR